MTIHILVEGPSERALLDKWVPRLSLNHTVRPHPHQGKGSLPHNLDGPLNVKQRGVLDQLPAMLRGFSSALNPSIDSIIVLVDADDDDVTALVDSVQIAAQHCAPNLRVGVCVATEETEAFYLSDLRALRNAYPEADMVVARAYVQDSICGTWELFGRIIGDDGVNKVAWAEAMGRHLTVNPAETRSQSFRGLIRTIREHLPKALPPVTRRPYRHGSQKRKTGV